MNRVDVLNALALAVAVAASVYGGQWSTGRGVRVRELDPRMELSLQPIQLPDGTRVLRDATGHEIPLDNYTRILSGSLVTDHVLSELCEPDRVVGFTRYGAQGSPVRHRLSGKPHVDARAPVERVLELKPQLMIVNNVVDPGRVARLRELGVRVFDLGHMRGLRTLLPNIRAIGWLIGAPERAEAYARSLDERLDRIATGVPEDGRPGAIYLAIYADHLYGGAGDTSYHDVIEHAGLRELGGRAGLDGWPQLSSEQILALNPDVLLTKIGMADVLCRHAGLSGLRPCSGKGRIIELPGPLLDDPGPSMLEASEALHRAYYGHPQ